jgi:hypothetical protein
LGYPPPLTYPTPAVYGYPPDVLVYVDDGSGAIPPATLAAAAAAVNATRAAGVSCGVFPATTLVAYVVMTIQTAGGFLHPTVVAQVQAALATYISVQNVTLNNKTIDLVPGPGQTIKAGVMAVS